MASSLLWQGKEVAIRSPGSFERLLGGILRVWGYAIFLAQAEPCHSVVGEPHRHPDGAFSVGSPGLPIFSDRPLYEAGVSLP